MPKTVREAERFNALLQGEVEAHEDDELELLSLARSLEKLLESQPEPVGAGDTERR